MAANIIIVTGTPGAGKTTVLAETLENCVKGAYSLSMIVDGRLVGIRDPKGTWPLWFAEIDGMYLLSSEKYAIHKLVELSCYHPDKMNIRKMTKGEVLFLSHETPLRWAMKPQQGAECRLDHVYMRSNEELEVFGIRHENGMVLAEFYTPKNADAVVPVPESGIIPARSFSKKSGIEYQELIEINPDFRGTRQFIGEDFSIDKFTYNAKEINGKILISVDDSIIKGNTMESLIRRLSKYGAKEVHVRVSFPPFVSGCKSGTHADKKDLIAGELNPKEVEFYFAARFYGVDYERNDLIKWIKEHEAKLLKTLVFGRIMPEFTTNWYKNRLLKELVAESAEKGKNFLGEGQRRIIDISKFSIRYLSLHQSDRVYRANGIDPHEICRGCVKRGGKGYAKDFRPYVMGKV